MESDYRFLGITYDGWFTGTIPVLIFFLGYLINKWIERRKENEQIKNLSNYIKNEILLLKEPMFSQISYYLSAARILKKNKLEHLAIDTNVSLSVKSLKEIKFEDLHKIHKIKDDEFNLKSISAFKYSINYIDSMVDLNMDNSKKLIEKFEGYQKDYNTAMDILESEVTRLFIELDNDKNEENFLIGIDNLRREWINYNIDDRPFTDMFVANEFYIEPFRQYCRKHLSNSHALKLLPFIMKVSYVVMDMEELRTVYKSHFAKNARNLLHVWLRIQKELL